MKHSEYIDFVLTAEAEEKLRSLARVLSVTFDSLVIEALEEKISEINGLENSFYSNNMDTLH